ncbi:MAG: von Willebrand factor type A [candidate division TM6 bacterium GW2011_GWF2_37_49]|nr:MAG: von Willebrand factor type A [candidate division TM6 bacterium GW2011_GWF2_37_49]
MIEMLGIHWAGFDKIIYFPIFLILIAAVIKNYFRIKNSSSKLYVKSQKRLIFPAFSLIKQRLKVFSLVTALIFIFLALLQPQWDKKEQNIIQEGRDLLIMLDISQSMLAKDLKPNRLEFAKLKIRTLVSKLKTDRVGLIVFSGSAFLQCPLTVDHAAFLMYLNHIDAETISSGTTSIENALQKSISVFKASQERKNKILVMITDGEDFSVNLGQAKNWASEQNIHLFAIGIGTTDGAPIPMFDNSGKQTGHYTEQDGKIAISKLNEELLSSITQSLAGNYIRSTYQDSDIDQLIILLHGFEKEKITEKQFSLYHDQYPWFLGIAWAMLLLDWIL